MVAVATAAPELALPADSVIRRIMDEIAAHPEVREPLLRTLLTEDLLALPVLVKEQGQRIDDLVGLVKEQGGRIDDLAGEMRAGFQRLDARIDGVRDELKDEIREAREETRQVGREVSWLRGRVGQFIGEGYEDTCRKKIDSILVNHLDRPVLIDPDQFRDDMERIRILGLISRNEYQQVREVDIAAGDMAADGTVAKYAIVEASVTVNNGDIDKVALRRDIVRRGTGIPADAYFITAKPWPERLSDYAAGKGVTVIRYELKYDYD